MTALSVDQYVEAVQKSGLLSTAELAAGLRQFVERFGVRPSDAGQLAEFLRDDGLLTDWQNDFLLRGKTKGFFLGKYKLLRILGSGGMGVVYLAEHTLMRRRVAVKVLPKRAVQTEADVQRFVAEARVIAQLDHPHIVRVFNVDSLRDVLYMVLEYVEGRDLEQQVVEYGPLPVEMAAYYIRQAADGLSHAHERGVVHRDVKPANLLVDSHDQVKIVDMGVAALNLGDAPTGSNAVVGTADYLAPEQALGKGDSRSDLYSLGCTLYYILTGRTPFIGASMTEVLIRSQTTEAPRLETLRPEIPVDLADVCRKLMAKNPEDRFPTAGDLRDALTDWLVNHGYVDTPVGHANASGETRSIVDESSTTIGDFSDFDFNPSEFLAQVERQETRRASPPSDVLLVGREELEAAAPNLEPAPAASRRGMAIVALALSACLAAGAGWLLLTNGDDAEIAEPSVAETSTRRKFIDPSVAWNEPVSKKKTPSAAAEVAPDPAVPSAPPPPPDWLPSAKLKHVEGKFGQALLCTGDEHLAYYGPAFEPEQFTAMAWVWIEPNPKSKDHRRWFLNKNGNHHGAGYYSLMTDADRFAAQLNAGGGPKHVNTALFDEPSPHYVWRHAASVFDGSTLTLFVDGQPRASKTVLQPRNPKPDPRPFVLAARGDLNAAGAWVGRLDAARLYRRALTAQEVADSYALPFEQLPPPLREGLVAAWDFEDLQEVRYDRERAAALRLIEDEYDFLSQLNEGDGAAELCYTSPCRGAASVKVSQGQVHQKLIPGFRAAIRKNPALGEYRFLRFAWKADAQQAFGVQLSSDGVWDRRYSAGPGQLYSGSRRLEDKVPAHWKLYTRDLAADFGEFDLTGLAFSVPSGSAEYDHVWLLREKEDHDLAVAAIQAPKLAAEPPKYSLKCGLGETVPAGAPYRCVLDKGIDYAQWPESAVRRHCWTSASQVAFTFHLPTKQEGWLRLLVVDGDAAGRRQTVALDDRQIVELSDFQNGRWVTLPISAKASEKGSVVVTLTPADGAVSAVVSEIQFHSK